jgi:hypothetical protein
VGPEGTVASPTRGARAKALSAVDRDARNGVRTSVRLCSAGTMIEVPRRLWRGAAVVLLQLAWLSPPATASAQTAQAVRVPRDSGGASASAGSTEHRYGPPESVRQRDAQLEATVPTRYAPPAGMCRVWVGGVPPERQPAPTECAKAIRVRSPNSHVVFGPKPRPVEQGAAETSPGMPGLAPGGHDSPAVTDHAQLPSDGHTTGSVAPVHQPGPGETPAAAAPPAGTGNATKPAPATTGGAVSHPQSHPHPSPPPKVTARPRR